MASPYTTIAEYSRADTEGSVTLVGNRHYAGRNYIDELHTTLIGLEESGAKVHYERIEELSDDEVAVLPEDLQIKYMALRALKARSQRYSSEQGQAGIVEVIEAHTDTWERHDASMVELAEHLSDEDEARLVRHLRINPLYRHTPAKLGGWAMDRVIRSLAPLIVGYRDEIALQAVDEAVAQNPTQKLVLLWGEGHIPGLSHGLKERGYDRNYTVLRDARL